MNPAPEPVVEVPGDVAGRLAELADLFADISLPEGCRPFAGHWHEIHLPTVDNPNQVFVEVRTLGAGLAADGLDVRVTYNGGQVAGRHVFRFKP